MGDSRLRFRRRKPPECPSFASSIQATTLATLTALEKSSDAFPPLKSAVGGVVHILELCDKVKSNQEECFALWIRVNDILQMIADVVPDPTQLSPDLLVRIEDFTRTLDNIQAFMECLGRRKVLTRIIHHKADGGTLRDLNRQLDDAFRSFSLISFIKIEMSVSRLEEYNKDQELVQESRHEATLALIRRNGNPMLLLVLFA